MTWCLVSSGILAWRILSPTFIKPLWKIRCKLAIFELMCTEISDDSALNSWGNGSCCITCKRSVFLKANSTAVTKLKLFLVGAPLFLFIQLAYNLMIHATWHVNVKNDGFRPQRIFDARLLCFLDVQLVTFVSLFSKCSLVMPPGSTVSSCLLFAIEFMLRLSEASSL